MHPGIRAGSDQDVEHCVDLWTRVIAARDGVPTHPEVRARARAAFERRVVRFAVVGSEPVAFALTLVRDDRTALLSRLCVDPARTSQGLGVALVADAADRARRSGFARIDLDVRDTNARAVALYTRAGFTAVSAPWDYDAGDPMVTMSLDLTAEE